MMESKIPLLMICGPTASGKTRLAVDLALRLNGEVVSADSMQIYREMAIGTAQPTPEEMQGIPHHLIGFAAPEDNFSVAQYVRCAAQTIREIAVRGRLPILAGGTGLYISSLIDNLRLPEITADPLLRERLRRIASEQGTEELWRKLRECDPDLAAELHPNDLGRVVRGLEVYHLTGTPLSVWKKQSRSTPSEYRLCMLGITTRDRQLLYERIDLRVGQMLEQGLVDEARRFFENHRPGTSAQAIGYKELAAYFSGNITLEAAAERIRQETRRYAKRQLTWFRKDKRIHWLYRDDYEDYALLLRAALAAVNFEPNQTER